MLIYTAEAYGDNKLHLKRDIGELVRRIYRFNRNPERFVDLSYKFSKVNNPEGKYRIEVKIKHSELYDSKFFIIRKPWKYKKAINNDYLNIIERIILYGLFPKKKEKKCH